MVVKLMAEVKAYTYEHGLQSCDCLQKNDLNVKIRSAKEGRQIKRVEEALERFSNKCPHTEKTEDKVNQAKLEGESSNRCEPQENLFAEVSISCRPLSDLKVAQGFSKPITIRIVKQTKTT